jgi:ankyrin repeat protein
MPSDDLHTFVAKNKLEVVKKLLKQIPVTVNQPASNNSVGVGRDKKRLFFRGNLPLEIAMQNQKSAMAKLLVENGADPNVIFEYALDQKMSAFSLACFRDENDLVLYFLQSSKFKIIINQQNAVVISNNKQRKIVLQNISALGIACLGNNHELVKILLQHNADIHQIFLDSNGNQFGLLTLAAFFGLPEMIAILCGYQANVNQPLKWHTPVITSALTACIASSFIKGDAEKIQILELLVKNGADIHLEINGMTPLITATIQNEITIIDWLINKGIRVDQRLTATGGSLNRKCFPSALMVACTRNHQEVINKLLQHGANINMVINEYEDNSDTIRTQVTPLMLAVDSNCIGTVVRLLMQGADAYFMTDQNVSENPGRSVLFAALDLEDVQMLRILLQHIRKTEHNNKTQILSAALTYASCYYSVVQVEMLLELIDPNVAPPSSLPLVIACAKGNANIVMALLQHNAKINKANPNGMSIGVYPLFAAVAEGQKEIVTILHQHGANPGLKIASGCFKNHNCFSILAMLDNPELLEYLLQLYPEIQPQQIEGYPPLLTAILTNNVRAVEILLCNNSSATKHFIEGYTPLSLAIELGHAKIITVLLKAGLDINGYFQFGGHAGRTPLFIAVLSRKISATQELIKNGADPFKKCDDELYRGKNAWQVAILLCDDEQQPDFLLALLTTMIDDAEQQIFLQFVKYQKLTALFAAVLMENISIVTLILSNMDKTEYNNINKIMSFGIYAGESPLAAAACLAKVDILRKFMSYDCDWYQTIISERIQNKTIFQTIQDKIQDYHFNFVLLIHLRQLKQNSNLPKPFDKDISNKNASTIPPHQGISDTLMQVTQKKLTKNKTDLGELIYKIVNKYNKRNEYEYYIYYADDHLSAIEDILRHASGINFDGNQLFNNDLQLNLLKYHLVRLFQALYLYGQRVQDNELLSANLCWAIRNSLMHYYADLSNSQIYQLGQYAKNSLTSVSKVKKKQENPITISFGLVTCHQKNTSSSNAEGDAIFSSWLSAVNNAKSNLHETVEYYTNIISGELKKIKNFLTVIDSSYKEHAYISNVTAIKMSLVHIGESYQQLNKINATLLENRNDIPFLDDCKKIRDIVGHEFNDDFHYFADNLDPVAVLRVAKSGLSSAECSQQPNYLPQINKNGNYFSTRI